MEQLSASNRGTSRSRSLEQLSRLDPRYAPLLLVDVPSGTLRPSSASRGYLFRQSHATVPTWWRLWLIHNDILTVEQVSSRYLLKLNKRHPAIVAVDQRRETVVRVLQLLSQDSSAGNAGMIHSSTSRS
ncbi:MAG TPA: hypothetical protein VF026_21260 [Ktedonobacteraceae bacterium]